MLGPAAPEPLPTDPQRRDTEPRRGGVRAPFMEEDRKRLLGELYRELHARAERLIRDQPRDTSLQATALVHEACLKIFGAESLAGADRPHLLALASTAMRQVLVDHARARGRV